LTSHLYPQSTQLHLKNRMQTFGPLAKCIMFDIVVLGYKFTA